MSTTRFSVKDTFYFDPSVSQYASLASRATKLGLNVAEGFLDEHVTICIANTKGAQTPGCTTTGGGARDGYGLSNSTTASQMVGQSLGRRRDRIHRMIVQAHLEQSKVRDITQPEQAKTQVLSVADRARELGAAVVSGSVFEKWIRRLEAPEARGGGTGASAGNTPQAGKEKAGMRAPVVTPHSRRRILPGTDRFKSQAHPRVVIKDLDGLEPDRVQAFPPELMRKCVLHQDAPPGICPFTPREQWDREMLKLKKKDNARPGSGKGKTSAATRMPTGSLKPRRGGWCECCDRQYIGTMTEHCAGREHKDAMIKDPNFDVLLELAKWGVGHGNESARIAKTAIELEATVTFVAAESPVQSRECWGSGAGVLAEEALLEGDGEPPGTVDAESINLVGLPLGVGDRVVQGKLLDETRELLPAESVGAEDDWNTVSVDVGAKENVSSTPTATAASSTRSSRSKQRETTGIVPPTSLELFDELSRCRNPSQQRAKHKSGKNSCVTEVKAVLGLPAVINFQQNRNQMRDERPARLDRTAASSGSGLAEPDQDARETIDLSSSQHVGNSDGVEKPNVESQQACQPRYLSAGQVNVRSSVDNYLLGDGDHPKSSIGPSTGCSDRSGAVMDDAGAVGADSRLHSQHLLEHGVENGDLVPETAEKTTIDRFNLVSAPTGINRSCGKHRQSSTNERTGGAAAISSPFSSPNGKPQNRKHKSRLERELEALADSPGRAEAVAKLGSTEIVPSKTRRGSRARGGDSPPSTRTDRSRLGVRSPRTGDSTKGRLTAPTAATTGDTVSSGSTSDGEGEEVHSNNKARNESSCCDVNTRNVGDMPSEAKRGDVAHGADCSPSEKRRQKKRQRELGMLADSLTYRAAISSPSFGTDGGICDGDDAVTSSGGSSINRRRKSRRCGRRGSSADVEFGKATTVCASSSLSSSFPFSPSETSSTSLSDRPRDVRTSTSTARESNEYLWQTKYRSAAVQQGATEQDTGRAFDTSCGSTNENGNDRRCERKADGKQCENGKSARCTTNSPVRNRVIVGENQKESYDVLSFARTKGGSVAVARGDDKSGGGGGGRSNSTVASPRCLETRSPTQHKVRDANADAAPSPKGKVRAHHRSLTGEARGDTPGEHFNQQRKSTCNSDPSCSHDSRLKSGAAGGADGPGTGELEWGKHEGRVSGSGGIGGGGRNSASDNGDSPGRRCASTRSRTSESAPPAKGTRAAQQLSLIPLSVRNVDAGKYARTR